MGEIHSHSEAEFFRSNTYSELQRTEENSGSHINELSIRSARNLEGYKKVFGEDFGKHEELILDVGAGDTTMADEIEALTDHKAKVVRLDRDYGVVTPEGSEPAVAGDAAVMPFTDESFDRVVSHNVMYYLGRDKGSEAASEILRVLKSGGEALIFPANPFKQVDAEASHKHRESKLVLPTLIVTKPEDFSEWSDDRRASVYAEIVKTVTFGKITDRLVQWQLARRIEKAGTHRTVELGSKYKLRPPKG